MCPVKARLPLQSLLEDFAVSTHHKVMDEKIIEVKNSSSYMDDMFNMDKDTIDTDSPVETSEVTEFYKGLNVFITGGSGFLGKLIIEKLLRSFPNIGKLYILMRAKKDKSPEVRFKEHFDDVIYEQVRREKPNYIDHVVMIEGDTSLSDLGLTMRDRETLVENVNIVFHGAATVRFDDPLSYSINTNVRGTKLIALLAKEMKNLQAFVHISTAFSYCVEHNIEEKFYEPPIDPDKIITLVDMLPEDLIKHITPKVIGKWPNTYAFSKAVSEEVIRRYCNDMPSCVVRPSIVIATWKEPLSGWINNIYGPTGVVMGAAVGLLHVLHCKGTNIADIIPADIVINNTIVSAWETAKASKLKENHIANKGKEQKEMDPVIYNSVSSCQSPINWDDFMTLNESSCTKVPSDKIIWHYSFKLIESLWIYNIYCFLAHIVPAAIVDFLRIIIGRDPMLLTAYRKIHKFSTVISYFSTREWKFSNNNVQKLWNKLNTTDQRKFYFNLGDLYWPEFFDLQALGLRKYLLKDTDPSYEKGHLRMKRLKIAHYTIVTIIVLLLIWALFSFVNVFLSYF